MCAARMVQEAAPALETLVAAAEAAAGSCCCCCSVRAEAVAAAATGLDISLGSIALEPLPRWLKQLLYTCVRVCVDVYMCAQLHVCCTDSYLGCCPFTALPRFQSAHTHTHTHTHTQRTRRVKSKETKDTEFRALVSIAAAALRRTEMGIHTMHTDNHTDEGISQCLAHQHGERPPAPCATTHPANPPSSAPTQTKGVPICSSLILASICIPIKISKLKVCKVMGQKLMTEVTCSVLHNHVGKDH